MDLIKLQGLDMITFVVLLAQLVSFNKKMIIHFVQKKEEEEVWNSIAILLLYVDVMLILEDDMKGKCR